MRNMKSGFGKIVYSNKKGDDEEGGEPEDDEEGAAMPRGGKYLGVFANNQRGCKEDQDPRKAPSEGTFSYPNGDVYVGQWRAGKKHGSGSYTFAKDETKLVGEWENGKIANGRWIFPNGTDAPRDNGSRDFTGQGKAEYKNGDIYDGDFAEGKRHGKGSYTFKAN